MKTNLWFKKGEYGLVLILLFFMSSSLTKAIERDSSNQRIKPARFFVFGSGIERGSLRDYGTSPLVYTGLFPVGQLGYEQWSPSHIFQTNLSSFNGKYKQKIFEKPFEIKANEFDLSTQYLRSVFVKDRINSLFFLGASLWHQVSIRNAEHFQNSGFVVDNISHFCAALGYRKTIQKAAREIKIGKFTLKRPERKFIFQSLLRLPVVSAFYRPGYVFIVNGTKEEYKTFDQYQLHFLSFRGLYLSQSITRVMRNGNALRLSYDWSVISSGNKLANRIEMARHLLQFTLCFRIN